MKLNIGCGNRILSGYLNIDKNPSRSEVTFGDIERGIELPDNSVEHILLDNVVEHLLDIPKAIEECCRLLRDGGTMTVITPHYAAAKSWQDPTHIHHLSYFSFDYLSREFEHSHIPRSQLRITNRNLSFGGGAMGLIGRLIFWLSPERYEKNWCFIFRPSTLRFTLQKVSA